MKEILTAKGIAILVDDADYEALNQYTWCVDSSNGYAVRAEFRDGHTHKIYMHRQIAGLAKGDRRQVDHRDGVRVNNVRSNLRICTLKQNRMNSRRRSDNASGFKGVHLHRQSGKYRASIHVNGKRTYLGLFVTAEAAHLAYCTAAQCMHGEFANFGS